MQPYFFPYLGYFSLIKHTDRFILLDAVQYIRHGWINRNRVLKPGAGWQYVVVPLEKHRRETAIRDIRVKQDTPWQDRILRQLEHYKKRAPHYGSVMELLGECLRLQETSIARLNAQLLAKTCAYLDIPCKAAIYSEMELGIDEVTDAGEWALHISRALGARQYINPPGGAELFDAARFAAAGIGLSFLVPDLGEYDQRRPGFEPGLSIIDVMMFNDTEVVRAMLDAVTLERAA